MNDKTKQIIFEHMKNAEYWRDEADPNDERDYGYFSAYNALEDLVDDLGLSEEYEAYKEKPNDKTGTKLYWVVRDNQGGSFGMGRVQNAMGWLEDMIEWRDADASWGSEEERASIISYWNKKISGGEEQSLIDYISEIWDIEFVKVSEEQKEAYSKYLEKLKNNSINPVNFWQWLNDNYGGENA